MQEKIEQFWQDFLKKNKLDNNTKYDDAFMFGGDNPDELLELVLEGKKKATSSLVKGYELENERMPEVGDYSIVLDSNEEPYCVIVDTKTTIIKFKDMTFDICKLEGEDDDLESWRKNHIKFFNEECKDMGIEFNEDLDVLFEEFKVVYSKSTKIAKVLNMPDADFQMLKNDLYEDNMYNKE